MSLGFVIFFCVRSQIAVPVQRMREMFAHAYNDPTNTMADLF